MTKVTIFKLNYCGFCRQTLKDLEELRQSNPEFRKLEIELVDEAEQRERARSFDYYYVPTFYIGTKKVHEGPTTREQVESILRQACQTEPGLR
jgi:thioredoxin 1